MPRQKKKSKESAHEKIVPRIDPSEIVLEIDGEDDNDLVKAIDLDDDEVEPLSSEIEEEEKESEEEEEEDDGIDLEAPSLELEEMIDDPVRMYLREMGQVPLLNSEDERMLACKMDMSKRLKQLEKSWQEIYKIRFQLKRLWKAAISCFIWHR